MQCGCFVACEVSLESAVSVCLLHLPHQGDAYGLVTSPVEAVVA
jgi:hypothetical protein